MSVPRKILIPYSPNSPFDCIGRYGNDEFLFLGLSVTRFDRASNSYFCYAIMHKFDRNGRYLKTEHWKAPETEPDEVEASVTKRDEMLKQIEPYTFDTIEVELFQTEIDGRTFGLVDQTPESDHEWVCLEETMISFYPPWDGRYDT